LDVKEFKAALPYLFKAGVTPLIWGIHGIGKSTIPEQFAAEGGHKLFNLRLGNMEIADLLGLPEFRTDKKGNKEATAFMMPDWLRDLFTFAETNPDKYAIIFLDEINRFRKDMLNPVFQMALDGRLHTYKFPPNVRVIAAANPPTAGYWVNDVTESAFMDRFCHLKFSPSTADWVDYAENTNVHKDLVDFIKDHPQFLHANQDTFSVAQYCKPSNRSNEAAARLMDLGAPRELVYGCIGTEAGAAFYSWLDQAKAKRIDFEDVLNNYEKVQKAVKKHVKEGRMAELKTIIADIDKQAKSRHETGPEYSLEQGSNVCKFLSDIPKDLAVSALISLCLHNSINRQIVRVDEDDKREGMEVQDKLFKTIEKLWISGEIDKDAMLKANQATTEEASA